MKNLSYYLGNTELIFSNTILGNVEGFLEVKNCRYYTRYHYSKNNDAAVVIHPYQIRRYFVGVDSYIT